MKIIIAILIALSPALSMAQSQEMIDGTVSRMIQCKKEGKSVCPILLSKGAAEKIQDHLNLAFQIDSLVTKQGLIISLNEVNKCVTKMEKITKTLVVKISDNGIQRMQNLFKPDFDWTTHCIMRWQVVLPIDDRFEYNADLEYRGAPVAFTKAYWETINSYFDMLKRETVHVEFSGQMTARITHPEKKKIWIFDTVSWNTQQEFLPKKISFYVR